MDKPDLSPCKREMKSPSIYRNSTRDTSYHHIYPNSYSPNQPPFFYPNDPTMNNCGIYRNQEIDFLPSSAMYGRTNEEFLHGWNVAAAAAHHHHSKIFN